MRAYRSKICSFYVIIQDMSKLKKQKNLLKKINIFVELLLVFAMYWLAVGFRLVLPYGTEFWVREAGVYMALAVLFSVTIVVVTYIMGGYFSFHIQGKGSELVKVFVSNLVGFCLTCTIIYFLKWHQFSRLLLAYFTFLSFISIYIKRVVVDKLVRLYDKKYSITNKVLLIGSGYQAQIIYRTILEKNYMNMHMVGYLADTINSIIPYYLGKKDKLREIMSEQGDISATDMILIADSDMSKEELHQIVVFATDHNKRVCIVPAFSEYLPSKNAINVYKGNYICELTALDCCNIMGVNISVTNMEKTVAKIKENLKEWSGKYICVSNVHTTVTASEDSEYLNIQNNAVIALPDGGPLSKFSRDKGYNGAERVTGPDLMKRILSESAENGWRHFFYGSTGETLEKLKKTMAEKYPGVEICGMISPPFRPLSVDEDEMIVNEIKKANPDFVWVGLGAPKQEVWMAAHQDRIPGLMIGVGAAFDYEVGNIKRAPKWMQKISLEWLYRLMQDPKRLFSRYLRTNTKYLLWKYRYGGKND